MDFIEDAWDGLLETLEYVFTFEWIGDLGDFFGGMFDSLADFSIFGLVFGVLVVVLVNILEPYMLEPFTSHMNLGTAWFWKIATYLCSFIIGYLVGKRMTEI